MDKISAAEANLLIEAQLVQLSQVVANHGRLSLRILAIAAARHFHLSAGITFRG